MQLQVGMDSFQWKTSLSTVPSIEHWHSDSYFLAGGKRARDEGMRICMDEHVHGMMVAVDKVKVVHVVAAKDRPSMRNGPL